MSKVRKAVIPAAGLVTRFLPATKAMPKEMLPIVDNQRFSSLLTKLVNRGSKTLLSSRVRASVVLKITMILTQN